MSSISDQLQAIDDFREWREQTALAGVDVSIEAYEAHLEAKHHKDLLRQIRGRLLDIVQMREPFTPEQMRDWLIAISNLADIEPKGLAV